MNPKVDLYLEEGCGRCSLHRTPQCKVQSFPEELLQLRRIALECGLTEEFKWSQPCYTIEGKNVLLVTAFKEYTCIAFFKGSLLKDPFKMLTSPGKDSQSTRQIRITNVEDVLEKEDVIKSYIFEAIENEKKGLKIAFKKEPEPIPEELKDIFNLENEFKIAFENLTPGRQRGYMLFFSAPKQSKTRISRIEKCRPDILRGKGLHDR